MSEIVAGTVNGTGSALRILLGFVPDWFWIWNLESNNEEIIRWDKNNRSQEMVEGLFSDNSTTRSPLTFGNGIAPYRAFGETFAALQTAYVVVDPKPDKRDANTGNDVLDTWVSDTPGSRTGHWNAEANTASVGEGSKLTIKESVSQKIIEVAVTAMTSNGDQADEVETSQVVQSGEIVALSGFADYVGLAARIPSTDGVLISETGALNVSGELLAFQAGRVM